MSEAIVPCTVLGMDDLGPRKSMRRMSVFLRGERDLIYIRSLVGQSPDGSSLM